VKLVGFFVGVTLASRAGKYVTKFMREVGPQASRSGFIPYLFGVEISAPGAENCECRDVALPFAELAPKGVIRHRDYAPVGGSRKAGDNLLNLLLARAVRRSTATHNGLRRTGKREQQEYQSSHVLYFQRTTNGIQDTTYGVYQ